MMRQDSHFPIGVLLVIVWMSLFHSYFVLNARLIDPVLAVFIGSWKEALFLVLSAWFVWRWVNFRDEIREKPLWLLTIILTLYGVLLGVSQGASIYNVAVNARDFMLPLYLYLLVSSLPVTTNMGIRLITTALLILMAIHGIVSVYDYITFDGSAKRIWVYEFFSNLNKGVPFADSNYIRDGILRSMGFFVSPLEYSMTLLFALYLSTYYFILSKSLLLKVWALLMGSYFLTFLLVAGVRAWIVCYLIGAVTIALVLIARKTRNKVRIHLLVPLGFVLVTFANIVFDFGMNDASSLGRLDQYISVPIMMAQFPFGKGFGEVGSKSLYAADSGVLTLLMAFGWAFLLLYLYVIVRIFIKPIRFLHHLLVPKTTSDIHFNAFVLAVMAYCASSIYILFFHEIIFYNFQYLLFLFLALATRKLEVESNFQENSGGIIWRGTQSMTFDEKPKSTFSGRPQ